tara:strand:- start:17371 stop:18792 length:1422 start_codon:yes stop_codon:yes gene_type:complete
LILKASQRGGAKQLGLHLLRTDENEHVEVHELRGFVSTDLIGALKETYAISKGTRCKQPFFSVSLNPPQTESVDIATFEDTANRIEGRMGLFGHPRILVFHEKEGRRHAHAIWSRIDAETMTAKNLPFFKNRLRDLSRDLYLENDWKMPRGLMNSETHDPRNFDLAEYQQAKRMGKTGRDLKIEMQECWAVSDSRTAFEHALNERGMILARGDRRGHVAVTHDGEVLSIARYTAKKAKEVRAKLGEPDGLASVEDAKAQMAQDMQSAYTRHIEEARKKTAEEKAELDNKRQAMTAAHVSERTKLDTAQKDRWTRETRERQERLNKGLRGLWDRMTGEYRRTQARNEQEAFTAIKRDRAQRDDLVSAQLNERQGLQTQILDWRQRQAELLVKLRTGKQERDRLANTDNIHPNHRRRVSAIRETNLPPQSTNSMKQEFNREASSSRATSAKDRLKNLREASIQNAREIEGKEPER